MQTDGPSLTVSDDTRHPVLVLKKKFGDFLIFSCTSKPWAPHKTPLHLLVDDELVRGRFKGAMTVHTAFDASRFTTLSAHHSASAFFVTENEAGVEAKDVQGFAASLYASILGHCVLTGSPFNNDDDDERCYEFCEEDS